MSDLDELAVVVREEWGRLVAMLLARFGRLDLVEDALGDAVEAAARHWPVDGAPDAPAAWLLTAARRRVLDRLRAEAMAARRHGLIVMEAGRGAAAPGERADPGDLVEDDVLRLVLMCCHPSLAPEIACALALRLVLGVSTHDIARLFLVPEPTMAARITRAKKKVVAAGIPFAIPGADVLPDRLATVAQTAYLAFTAGYAPGSGPELLRVDLAGEALRLTRTVHSLRPDDPTLTALLALMVLQHSRRDARVDGSGRLVLLAHQDRASWRRDEIVEALGLLGSGDLRGPLPPTAASYVLQARIAAEHATAPTAGETRWARVVALYDLLLRIDDGPATRLARAVAVAEARGPAAGLAAVEDVDWPGNHRPAVVRGELLLRMGQEDIASRALDEAIGLCGNDAERAHLQRRRQEIGGARTARSNLPR